MKISITARKMDLSDSLREYVEEKLGKLDRYMDGIMEVRVLLSTEKHWQIAEASLHAPHADFTAKESGNDLHSAVDGVTDKLERQMRKYKTRMLNRRNRKTVAAGAGGFESGSITILGSGMEVEEYPQVIQEKILHLDRLSPSEAISRMEVHGDDFWIFNNSETEHMCIVYRRKDDNYGLIQPEE